jgi:hypothetical protein
LIIDDIDIDYYDIIIIDAALRHIDDDIDIDIDY